MFEKKIYLAGLDVAKTIFLFKEFWDIFLFFDFNKLNRMSKRTRVNEYTRTFY
jgi:hypothetical protein